MINSEDLRDFVYLPITSMFAVVFSFLWNQRRVDRKELKEEIRTVKDSLSKSNATIATLKENQARIDERIKGLEK